MTELIPGVESLGNRVIERAVRQDPNMRVFIANVCCEGTGQRNEPTLIVGRRTLGRGRSFMVPLSTAWQYNEVGLIDDKARTAAAVLYGSVPSKGECRVCADVILEHLPYLFNFAPDDDRRKLSAGLERLLEQYQVNIEDGEGRIVLDARA